jgi:hypothetical protein
VPVRTKRLFAGDTAPAGSGVTAYTCPAGETTILKDIRASNQSGSPSRLIISAVSGAARTAIVDEAATPLPATIGRSPWVVLQPGDQIELFSLGGVVAVWLSGAELEGLAD